MNFKDRMVILQIQLLLQTFLINCLLMSHDLTTKIPRSRKSPFNLMDDKVHSLEIHSNGNSTEKKANEIVNSPL